MSKISCPMDCVPLLNAYSTKRQEVFGVVCLDGSHNVICKKVIFIGSATICLVHPREILRYAIIKSAVAIIVFHNHPSGDTSPSEQDFKTTNKLIKAAEVVGIQLLDHIIIGKSSYYSFAENTDLFKDDMQTLCVAN